jgi:hypothetical protein
MSISKKPTNSSKSKKKQSSPEKSTSVTNNEKLGIEQLFEQALARHNKEVLQDKKQKHKEIDHLALMTEEYLSCFALIGYTLQGEQVSIFNANNAKDEAAVVDLLRATFLEIANNRP